MCYVVMLYMLKNIKYKNIYIDVSITASSLLRCSLLCLSLLCLSPFVHRSLDTFGSGVFGMLFFDFRVFCPNKTA